MATNVIRNVLNFNKNVFLLQVTNNKCLYNSMKLMSSGSQYQYIKVETKGKKNNVALITLNRPKALNVFSGGLITEVAEALDKLEGDSNTGAIVITGNEKVFSAGADINEMKDQKFAQSFMSNFSSQLDRISRTTKPVIAAVNGYAFTVGCEVAMMCDIIYAGDNAIFAQLEVNVGTIPGAGGTQRLTRAIGKSRAMEMTVTGKHISAKEAEAWGLVSKVFPKEQVVDEAIKLGEKISEQSKLMVAVCKESVNNAFETTLEEGLKVEKHLCQATFATHDQKEGMNAFVEKRAPDFKDC